MPPLGGVLSAPLGAEQLIFVSIGDINPYLIPKSGFGPQPNAPTLRPARGGAISAPQGGLGGRLKAGISFFR